MPQRLANCAPDLATVLKSNELLSGTRYSASEIRVETVFVPMRDGIRLATDVYLPPQTPAPAIVLRTPYGRGADYLVGTYMAFARRGYVVVSQDCRGTGDSEPDSWEFYMYEPEDGLDFVDWISRQSWFDGFIGSHGGSYVGQTQWPMATHPAMSTIVPSVSGLGVAINTAHLHMFLNAYARSVGKGDDKLDISYPELECRMVEETLATGYFNEPLHKPFAPALQERFPSLTKMPPMEAKNWLWEHYCSLSCAGRAEFVRWATGSERITILETETISSVFGMQISHDRQTLPHPQPADMARILRAPALLKTGWYDWGVNDALATWKLLMRDAPDDVRARCRLLVGPGAHNKPGYHEGMAEHAELQTSQLSNPELLLRWYEAVRTDNTDSWPTVIYYLMGANEWNAASAWPPIEAQEIPFYLGADGALTEEAPTKPSAPDCYDYDPQDPTPTIGGSIVSYAYLPGSVDVSQVQKREDVLTYTTEPLDRDVDVVGPIRLILYASSSATDTDFVGRLSDVFPDGRALQLQNGLLRARYRDPENPALLEPGQIYRLEIDMWATANRFKAGHRIRLDISSSDFPKLDRNSNRGGEDGPPIIARQSVYHDPDHSSHLLLAILPANS